MMEILDYKLVATDLVQKALDRTIAGAANALKRQLATAKVKNPSTFIEYLCRKASQVNSVRNLVYYTKSVPLYDIFVPTRLSEGSLSGGNIIKELTRPAKPSTNPTDSKAERATKAYIIAGRAGTGKSLFMRHSFFAVQYEREKRIPIFLELRTFNRSEPTDIIGKIQEDLLDNGTEIPRDQLASAAEAGLFILLLDGLDELKPGFFSHYEQRLFEFIKKYPLCPVMVSSRMFDALHSWSPFEIRRLSKLSLDESDMLISKLDFDPSTKDRFRIALNSTLYREYHQFASNPLLCTVMFLTFSYYGRISHLHHEFFEDTYNTLCWKHDDRKNGDLERPRYTKLPKRDFGRLVNGFAFSSYHDADYEMTDDRYIRHFERACSLTGIFCDADDFQTDLTLSTCLALKDGPFLEFCHRSLHEYFVSCFICEIPETVIESAIDDFADRIETDSVIPLILSINEEKIEKYWILPKIASIRSFLSEDGASLQSYGKLLASESGKTVAVAKTLESIRILYGFEPRRADLLASYYAGVDMRDPRISYETLERDQDTFIKLFAEIEQKYRTKTSALDTLLKKQKLRTKARTPR